MAQLERQLQSELDESRRLRRKLCLVDRSTNLPSASLVEVRIGQTEVSVIENVKELGAKLKFVALGDSEILEYREVKVHKTRTHQAISACVPESLSRRYISTWVEPIVSGMDLGGCNAVGIGSYGPGPVQVPDNIRTYRASWPGTDRGAARVERTEGQTALHDRSTVDLPAADHLVHRAAPSVHVLLSLAKRKIVNGTGYESVGGIVVGGATFCSEIKGILRL